MQQIGYPGPARGIDVDIYGHDEPHGQQSMLFAQLHPGNHPMLPTGPMQDNFESSILDAGLEVSWRDLACLDSHFNNPFIFSGSFDI
jgi:hypothetical protein